MEITIVNNLTCRCCLEDYDILNDLYDAFDNDGRLYLDLLKRVSNVEISQDLQLTTRICENCTGKLILAYNFVLKVEESEKTLIALEQEEKYISTDDISYTTFEEHYEYADTGPAPAHIDFIEQESQELEILEEEFEVQLTDNENFEDGEEESLTESIIITNEPIVEEEEIPNETNLKKCQRIGSRLGVRKTSNWHKCDKCDRSFAKIETLEKHYRTAHTHISPERIAAMLPKNDKNNEQLHCEHCPRMFVRKDNLLRHLVTAHANKVDEKSIKAEIEKRKHTYKRGVCPHCGESFPQASLKIHIRRHTGFNPYKCTECDKAFPRRQDLTIHQRHHTGERPHICTICGKSFIRPNKLARHMRIHTGQRPYKCTKCEKCFAQSNDLKIHLRRHTGEKPYVCGICGDAFICGAALKVHRNTRSHHEPIEDSVDPYEKFRVINRNNGIKEIIEETEDLMNE